MLKATETNTTKLFVLSLAFFLVGGLLTTALPAVIEAKWREPTPGMRPYTDSEARGRAIYVKEGCWYCHTQQTRTIEADTIRSGWRGEKSPVSTPDEFVYDQPHMFGTRRVGPDLSRVGGKYDGQWHAAHFRDPRSLVPGSVMPPFPWIANDPKELAALTAYIQSLGRVKNWRPSGDYEQ